LVLVMHSQPVVDITNKLFLQSSAIIAWQN